MSFFGVIALILLTLVGYSSGAVIAGRGRKEPVGLFDLVMAVAFLAMALGTRSLLGKWLTIPIWFIFAGLGSALLIKIRYKDGIAKKEICLTQAEKGFLRRTWDWWKAFAAEMGNYQGRLLFGLFYFVVITAFGIGVRLFSDPLNVKQGGSITRWLERSSVSHELKAAREQF